MTLHLFNKDPRSFPREGKWGGIPSLASFLATTRADSEGSLNHKSHYRSLVSEHRDEDLRFHGESQGSKSDRKIEAGRVMRRIGCRRYRNVAHARAEIVPVIILFTRHSSKQPDEIAR
jgi:hypothetical protein